MLYLAWCMVRRRIAALLAVACAAFGGAALVTSIGVVAESGLRSHLPVGRLAGADVVVSAAQSVRPAGDLPVALPERARVATGWADRLRALPGVTAVVGDVSFPAAVVDGRGAVVALPDPATAGHGWSSTTLLHPSRVTGRAPAGPGEVAVDAATAATAGVRPGEEVRVIAAGRPATYRVSAVVTGSDGGLFFDDPTARELAGRSRGGAAQDAVDLIAVRAAPGAAAAVTAHARDLVRGSGLVVSTGPARGDVVAPAATAARGLLPVLAGSMAGVVVLVVGFIVGGALAVSIGAQRRDLALMRAVGATPRQIRHLAAGQATVVAVAAAVPGLFAGYLLTDWFRLLLEATGLIPAALPLTVGPLPAVAALLLVIAVVQVAARCVVRRTSRMPATAAVAEARSEPRTPSARRGLAGLALLVVAQVVSVMPLLNRSQAGAAVTAMAGIIAAIGLALAGPVLLDRAGRLLARRMPAGASAPAWLAVANSRGYVARTAAAVTTLAMAVVFTLTYAYTQTTVLRAVSDDAAAARRAQVSITAPALGGLPEDVLARVRATSGVRAAAPVTTTSVLWPYRLAGETEVDAAAALVLTPDAPAVLDLDVRAGSLAGLSGATVAVAADAARSRGVSVGSEVSMTLGDGAPVRARVVAVYARGLAFGPVVLSRDLAAGHTGTGLAQEILVHTDGDEQARRGLAALAASRPGLTVADTGAGAGGGGSVPTDLWVNIAVLVVLLGYVLLGIANKLVAGTAGRRAELALLQLVGATPRQLRSMMRREAALICAAALAAGVLTSVVPIGLLSTAFLGRPWPAGPLWLPPAIAVVVAAIAFLSIELPTRRALRTPPVRALSQS